MPKILSEIIKHSRFWLVNKTFPFFERLGFHLTVNHFYSVVPDLRSLDEDLWLRNSELVGLSLNPERQLELLELFVDRYKREYDLFPKDKTAKPYEYHLNNTFFGGVDASILYCMIRHFKPKRIIEVGSGFSTYVSCQAIEKNKQENAYYHCELLAFDPFPNDVLCEGFPGLSSLKRLKAQNIPFSEFEQLTQNDILFVDSTHVLKIGSDVQYLCLEVLPRLNNGVIIHVHDIFLPAEYPKDWVKKLYRFWNEQYLLQAFLSFNNAFEVLWAGNYMRLKHPDQFKSAFNKYENDEITPNARTASFWFKRIK